MTSYTFAAYRGRAEHTFTCPCCGGKNRKRSFTAEHTVNPFNKNPDGSMKQPLQVSADARAEAKRLRDEFATEPLCKRCEDNLSSDDLRALRKRRTARSPTLSKVA